MTTAHNEDVLQTAEHLRPKWAGTLCTLNVYVKKSQTCSRHVCTVPVLMELTKP